MVGTVFIEESGAVAQIPGRERAPRQSGAKADAERISLVVVEEKKSLVRRCEIGETTCDRSGAFDELMGIGQIKLEAIRDARRPRGQFPTVNACAIDRQRKENVGIAEHVMIEEIPNVRLEIGNIKLPAVDGDGQAEFALFVPFAVQRQELKPLIDGFLLERPGNCEKRRSLIVAAVEGAENPVQFRHAKSCADARIDVVFSEPTRKMRIAEPAVESEPIGDAVLVFREEREEPASWVFRLAKRRTGAVSGHEAKECVVLLRESIEARARIVLATRDSKSHEATFIVRVMVIGRNDARIFAAGRQTWIRAIIAVIGGAIPMVERRERNENARIDGVHPGEIPEDVPFALNIAHTDELLIGGVWNLKIVRTGRSDEAKLICRRRIKNQ